MKRDLRTTIQFYLIDCKTPLGRAIDIFIILLNLLVCVSVVIESYPVSASTLHILSIIDYITVSLFTIEFIARLYGARERLRHLRNIYTIIDFIAILPTLILIVAPAANVGFIKLLRIFKALRIFRFLRFMQDPDFFFGTISVQLLKVIRLMLTILIIFFVSAGMLYNIESASNPGMNTFGDAFYFTVVSLTTVGFGDITPVTQAGRWVTVLMIISGIILIPWQASQIVREWVNIGTKQRVVCRSCGLNYHDKDASHCKHCGTVIYHDQG